MKVDELSDFNEVIKYYKELLKTAKKLNPRTNIAINNFDFGFNSLNEFQYFRVLCNNISLFISQIHEKSLEINDDELLEVSFNNIESIKNIKGKNKELSLLEKKRQLRNCLAHANYSLIIEKIVDMDIPVSTVKGVNLNTMYIEVENDYIEGRIPVEDIIKFAEKYKQAFAYFKKGRELSFLINTEMEKTRTTEEYLQKTKRIKVLPQKDDSGLSFEKFIYRFNKTCKIPSESKAYFHSFFKEVEKNYSAKSFELEEQDLPEAEKDFIKKYIDYIGFRRYKENQYCTEALNDILASINNEVVSLEILSGINNTLYDVIKQKKIIYMALQGVGFDRVKVMEFMQKSVNELLKYQHQGPIIYSNNLLGLSYYCFNYSREINEKKGKSLFNLYDVKSLDGIKAKLIDKDGNETEENIIEEINPRKKAENKLKDIVSQLEKLRKDKQLKENLKSSLENPKNRNPKKEEILNSIDKWMEDYVIKEQKLIEEIEIAETDIENTENRVYKDSSNFFRHLRNSMAHGNYKIIYDNFYNTDNIKYSFRDYDEKTDSTYCIEITAKQLEEIVNSFQEKINECDNGYIDGKRIEKKILEEALKSHMVDEADIETEQKRERTEDEKEEGEKNNNGTEL